MAEYALLLHSRKESHGKSCLSDIPERFSGKVLGGCGKTPQPRDKKFGVAADCCPAGRVAGAAHGTAHCPGREAHSWFLYCGDGGTGAASRPRTPRGGQSDGNVLADRGGSHPPQSDRTSDAAHGGVEAA